MARSTTTSDATSNWTAVPCAVVAESTGVSNRSSTAVPAGTSTPASARAGAGPTAAAANTAAVTILAMRSMLLFLLCGRSGVDEPSAGFCRRRGFSSSRPGAACPCRIVPQQTGPGSTARAVRWAVPRGAGKNKANRTPGGRKPGPVPEHRNPEIGSPRQAREGRMTKAQFAARLAEKLSSRERTVSKAEAGRIVDEITSLVTTVLKRGDKVRFPGFGSFRVSKRKARTARNPQTGEPVRVPARTVPRFTAAKELKAAIK